MWCFCSLFLVFSLFSHHYVATTKNHETNIAWFFSLCKLSLEREIWYSKFQIIRNQFPILQVDVTCKCKICALQIHVMNIRSVNDTRHPSRWLKKLCSKKKRIHILPSILHKISRINKCWEGDLHRWFCGVDVLADDEINWEKHSFNFRMEWQAQHGFKCVPNDLWKMRSAVNKTTFRINQVLLLTKRDKCNCFFLSPGVSLLVKDMNLSWFDFFSPYEDFESTN